MSEQERFSVLLAQIIERFGPSLNFTNGAAALGFPSVRAAYQARFRGNFPVKIIEVGGALRISAADVAQFLIDGKPQKNEPTAPQRRKPGRPSNAERARRMDGMVGGEK